jgi:hypothetical protein
MAVTMKNAVLWDVTLSGSCENRRFGGTCNELVTANGIPISLIFSP